MSELHSLIRLGRWKLDEKRRALAEMHALADRLRADRERLEAEIRHEQEVAGASQEIGFSYAGFAGQAIDRRRRLDQSILQVQERIEEATGEVAAAFQELKRYELAQEGRDRREGERRRRKEGAALDEIALTGFMRRRREAGEG
jgi:flagellar protein FliJ